MKTVQVCVQDFNRVPGGAMQSSKSADSRAEWMKVSEAAGVIGVHPKTIRAMLRDGRVKVRTLQIDQATRIHRGDWEAELAKRISVPVSA